MKKLIHSLSVRQIVLGISSVLSFLVCLLLLWIASLRVGGLEDQRMAERWSEEGGVAQVSCFFSQGASVNTDTIESFRHSIDPKLQEASIEQDSPNASARLWADAYSASGKVTVSSDKSTLSADAIGVGGDFFLFHPLKLLDGAYFSESDMNSDYCILDEVGAWQLFGSNDVAGMTVFIGNHPHIVAGVVRQEKGRIPEAAGLDKTIVYVSYDTLQKYGSSYGINHYEVVMPNPVRKFAYNFVMENIGVDEKDREVVENSTRFGFSRRFEVLAAFGTRSMNRKAIIYPYWENIARGYEDVVAILALFAALFLAYPAAVLVIFLIIRWKHKTWTVGSVYLAVKDKGERQLEKIRAGRREKKEKKRAKKERAKKYKDRFDEEEEYDER